MIEFEGRVVVITGAARGIGESTAQLVAARGGAVVLADIDEAAVHESVARIGQLNDGQAIGVRVDVGRQDDHESLADAALAAFGRIDGWVNNAGIFPSSDVETMSGEDLHATFAINLDGALFGSQAAARRMTSGGSIVNMASVLGHRVRPGYAAYSASKAAVEHLSRCMAVEWGPRGIRVNSIAPGFIDTRMTSGVQADPDVRRRALELIPLGRLGRPPEVAAAIAFLLSDDASYVTGSTLVVDGARSL